MEVEKLKKVNYSPVLKLMFLYCLLLLLFSLILSVFYGNGILMGIKFVLFQVFGIMIPGMALLCLLHLEIETTVEWIGFSYFFGFCLNLFEYLCIVPLELQRYATIFMLVISLLSILVVVKEFRKNEFIVRQDSKGEIICCSFLTVMFAIAMFTSAGTNLIPPKAEENILLNDLLYWVGNTIELTKEFPPKNFRNYPSNYNYHYFSSLQLAFESLVTGIRPIVISLAYSFFQSMMLLVFGAYILFCKCTSKVGYIVLGMLILFFTSGDENGMIMTYTGHMYYGGFGFEYGMGVFLFFLFFVLVLYQNKPFSFRMTIITIFTLGINMGMKTPFACIGLCGIGIVCVGWLFHKEYRKAFITGIPILAVFILGFFFVVNVIGYGGSYDVLMRPTVLESNGVLRAAFEQKSGSIGRIIPHCVENLIMSLMYFGHCHPAVFFFVLFSLLYNSIIKRSWKWIDTACLFMIGVGVWISVNIGMVGSSNMYFMMAIYPVCIVWFLFHVDTIKHGSWWLIPFSVCFCIAIFGFWKGYSNASVPALVKKGAANYFKSQMVEYDALDRSYICRSQYEAYEFIRNTTTTNTLITTNKELMIVGVFTERYVIGTGSTNPIFTATNIYEQNQAIENCRNNSIEYIVYDKATSPEFELLSMKCEVCYQNDSTIIYHIL